MAKHVNENRTTPVAEESMTAKRPEGKDGSSNKVLIVLGIVLIGLLPALCVYYWQSNEAKQQQATMQKQIDTLQKTNDALAAAAKKAVANKGVNTCPSGLTPTQIDNVHSAVESMNTAALDGLMTANVDFSAAASGKTGSETKTTAMNDLASFLTGVNASWEWNIAAPTLATYKTGSYKLYTADDTIYGASIDKHFVSFRVTCGKIDQVFVAANTDLLP